MRLAAALVLALLAAGDGETVVVLPFTAPAGSGQKSVAEAARDLASAALASSDGVRLVDREALDAVLDEHLLRARAGEEAARIGGLVKATRAVKGTVGRTQETWRVVLTLVEVPGGAVLGTVTEADASLVDACQTAAGRLAELAAGTKPNGALRESARARASLHYLRGIGYARAGLSLEAIGELLEAKRLEVRFPETRYWMARAYLDAGLPEHALVEARAFLAAAPDHALAAKAREIEATAKHASPAASRLPAAPAEEPSTDLRRRLTGPRTEDRAAARRELTAMLGRGGEERGRALALLREMLRSEEPDVSLGAIEPLIRAGERGAVIALMRQRLADERWPASYRAEMLQAGYQVNLYQDGALDEVLYRLITHENDVLREKVFYAISGKGYDEAPEPVVRRALEAIRERRFPRYASRLAGFVYRGDVPCDPDLARTLLKSEVGSERHAGFLILMKEAPEEATERAWDAIVDPWPGVREVAWLHLERTADPEPAFSRLLDEWDTHLPEIENPNFRSRYETLYHTALRELAKRAFDFDPTFLPQIPTFPALRARPDAFREWFTYWRERTTSWRRLSSRWEQATAAERPRLIVAMGSTGRSEFLSIWRRLRPEEREGLGAAFGEALLAYAKAIGYTGETPAADADDRTLVVFAHRLARWQDDESRRR